MALYSPLSDFAVNLLTIGVFLGAKGNETIQVPICLSTRNAVFDKDSLFMSCDRESLSYEVKYIYGKRFGGDR